MQKTVLQLPLRQFLLPEFWSYSGMSYLEAAQMNYLLSLITFSIYLSYNYFFN